MCGHTTLLSPPAPSSRAGRRRSADIGGLCLATKSAAYLASLDNASASTPGGENDSAASWDSQGAGKGWLGQSEGEEIGTRFAELLSDMYTETLNAVNEHAASCPPDLPPSTRAHLISLLSGWNFEPSALPDEDHVAACAVLLFEALFRIVGMREAVGVDIAQIPPFIAHLRAIYRTQNSYHNFAHALDVLQATYSYLRAAEMVPPVEILLSRAERSEAARERSQRDSSTTPGAAKEGEAKKEEGKGGAGKEKKGASKKGRGPAEVGEGTGGAPSPQTEVDAGEEADEMWLPPRAFDSGPLVTVLGREELFVLAVAAIGHDVGHPGFTNLFMANAAAPLSAVFDGQSPLEQLHCALLMRVMRAHGMGGLLDGTVPSSAYSSSPTNTGSARGENTKESERKENGEKESKTRAKRVRRLLADVVLATDMRVHGAFMERFEGLVASEAGAATSTTTTGGSKEESLEYRRTTLCQGIIKCADISNPSRPYYISKHWAKLLLREWNAQAALERHHRLPATVEASGHPLREAHSQMFFIPAFVKPLLDLVVRGVPEMKPYAAQCDFNLALWKARLAILQCRRANEIEAEKEKEKDGKDTTQNGTNDKNENDTNNNDRDNDNNVEEEDDPRPRYVGAFPLALPPSHFGGHFSWSSTAPSTPASPRPGPGSRPPSSFSMANGRGPPPPSSSSTSSSSTGAGARRRERALSSFSSQGDGEGGKSEGEGDAESMSEASFAPFSPASGGSRSGSSTTTSPGVPHDSSVHVPVSAAAHNVNGDAANTNNDDDGSEGGSEYETAWNGSEGGRSSAGWTGGANASASASAVWSAAGDSRPVSSVYLASEDAPYSSYGDPDDERGSRSRTAGIRAAARLAGLKSIRHGHAPHRNSWSPAMREEWVAQMAQMSAGVS